MLFSLCKHKQFKHKCIIMLNAVSKEMVSKTQKWAKSQKNLFSFRFWWNWKPTEKLQPKYHLTTLKTFFFRIGVGDTSLSLYPFLGLNIRSATPMTTFFRVEVVFLLYRYVLFAFQFHQSSKSNRSEGILAHLWVWAWDFWTPMKGIFGGKSGILAVIWL